MEVVYLVSYGRTKTFRIRLLKLWISVAATERWLQFCHVKARVTTSCWCPTAESSLLAIRSCTLASTLSRVLSVLLNRADDISKESCCSSLRLVASKWPTKPIILDKRRQVDYEGDQCCQYVPGRLNDMLGCGRHHESRACRHHPASAAKKSAAPFP